MVKDIPFFKSNSKKKSIVDIFNDTLSLDQDDNNQVVLKFRLSTGKGTAPVRIPVDLVEGFISVLEAGPPQRVENENVIDTVRSSLELKPAEDDNEQDAIIFRTGYGRGSKIQEVPVAEYDNLVIALKEVLKQLPGALSELDKLPKKADNI